MLKNIISLALGGIGDGAGVWESLVWGNRVLELRHI